MNKGKSFEGFEVTMNEVKMSVNMYVSITVSLALIGLAIILVHNFHTYPELWKKIGAAFLFSLKKNDKVLLHNVITVIPEVLWFSKKIIIVVGVGFIPALWLAVKFFKNRAIRNRMSEHIRGARIVPVSWIKKKMLFKAKNIPIGELKLLVNDEVCHVFVIGRTRTGKSQVLKRIVHHLQRQGNRLIIYENKGDFLPSFFNPEKDVLFCPVDKRSVKWSIWNDIETMMDIDQVICWSLIPQAQGENPFWPDAAREVLKAGLYHLYRKFKGKVTNKQIYKFFSSGADHIASCIKTTPEGKAAFEMISDPESKQTQGVLSTLLNYISCLQYIKDLDGDFSVREWVKKDGPGNLFVMNTAKTKDVFRPLLTLMLDIASQEILSMSEDRKRRRYIMLDEFGTLHPMNSIIELLTRGGGMGASVFIGVQDIGQIDQKYGANLRKSIVNSCGTKLFLAVDEADTKEYISNLINDTEVSEVNDTSSIGLNSFRDGKSITRSSRMKRLILPSELDLPALTGILKMPAVPYTMIKIPIINLPAVHKQCILRHDMYIGYLLENIPQEGSQSNIPIVEDTVIHKDHENGKQMSYEIDLD